MAYKGRIVVETEIRTVDFNEWRKARKTLLSLRSEFSARANDNLENRSLFRIRVRALRSLHKIIKASAVAAV
ncbi:hypothetical protein IGI04_023484, partial [Brassica rapa subsp. trilocularis]